MAFLTGSMSIQVYTDSAQTNYPMQYSLNEAPIWANNSVVSAQTTSIHLAASGSQAISLNGLGSTVTAIYFYSDSTDINLNFNGLGNILCKAATPGFFPATISSLTITNSSGSVATNVTIALIGT